MQRRRLIALASPVFLLAAPLVRPGAAAGPDAPPQGTQSDSAYAQSGVTHGVKNVFATTQTSCYRPEVSYTANSGPNDGYTGQTPCTGATSGENTGSLGPYPTQLDSNSGFASAEGYNHLLGFYESWDGGKTWPVQGHIPGYEGWTDNTDPVGAFDGFGNYYELLLPYQFAYKADGSMQFNTG